MIRLLCLLLLTSVLFGAVHASDEVYRDAGAGAYSFLKIDLGARAAAMGGTGVVNGGPLSIFTNPALLASLDRGHISAGHNQWLGDAAQSYLAWSFLNGGIYGSLGGRFLHVSGLEWREEATSDPVDTFSATDMSLHAALAVRLGMFDLGLGMKYIREKIWLESSSGLAMDAGVVVHPAVWLDLAAVIQHIGPKVTMVDSEYRLPLTWRIGASSSFGLPLGRLAVSCEVRKPLDNRPSAGAGLEYSPLPWLSVRGGMRFMDDTREFTAGAGFGTGGWTLDYAFVPSDFALGSVHRFTLGRSL